MLVLEVVCYVMSMTCFFASVFKTKVEPKTLDFIALGLFFFVLPFAVIHIHHLLR